MAKRAIILSILIVAIELIILWASLEITDLDTAKYSLAARYSARVTLLLFEGLLIWTAIVGLKGIYKVEASRQWLVLVLLLIAVNHIMHFFYLYANHVVNDYLLFTPRTGGGMLGYVIIITAPIILWNRRQLTKKLYRGLLFAFLFVDVIALVSYLGRWNKDLPMASPKELYIGIMLVIGLILFMNVYRIFAEQKVTVETTED